MGVITTGIGKIEFGEIAADGGVSTTFAAWGYTLEGSAAINTDDPTETEFKVEEIDAALDTDVTAGKMSLTLTIADPDEETLVNIFGGAKTGTGAATVYTFPTANPVVEKSIKVTPKKGLGIIVPRAKLTGKFSSEVGRGKLLGIEITGTILQPTKSGVGKFSTFRV